MGEMNLEGGVVAAAVTMQSLIDAILAEIWPQRTSSLQETQYNEYLYAVLL